jgi:hypothetical protein
MLAEALHIIVVCKRHACRAVFHFSNRPVYLFGGFLSATTETMCTFESTQAAKQSSCGNFVTATSNVCNFWFGTPNEAGTLFLCNQCALNKLRLSS